MADSGGIELSDVSRVQMNCLRHGGGGSPPWSAPLDGPIGARQALPTKRYITSLEVRLRLREGNIREVVQGEGLLHQRLSASGNRQVYVPATHSE